MLFDTDIFIWVQRGNEKAARVVNRSQQRFISVFSYMELIQSAKDGEQLRRTRDFISALDFVVLPLTEDIGHRALIYLEQYTLSHGLRAGDAIIAATASENNMVLISGNAKHFSPVKELNLKVFKP